MNRHTLVFSGPREVRIEASLVPEPGPDQLLVETDVSAISAGTEMLVYRDQFPRNLSVDAAIEGMGDTFSYPLQYGYAAVGHGGQFIFVVPAKKLVVIYTAWPYTSGDMFDNFNELADLIIKSCN